MQQILASYLVNAAWQVPVVAICAFIISRFGGLSPRGRNGLWLVFLGVAAILPAITLSTLLPHMTPTVARVPIDALVDAQALAALHTVPAADPAVALPPWSAWTMIAVFAVVAAVLMARLAVAAIAATRLVRQSKRVELPAEIIQAVEVRRRLEPCRGGRLQTRYPDPQRDDAARRGPARCPAS